MQHNCNTPAIKETTNSIILREGRWQCNCVVKECTGKAAPFPSLTTSKGSDLGGISISALAAFGKVWKQSIHIIQYISINIIGLCLLHFGILRYTKYVTLSNTYISNCTLYIRSTEFPNLLSKPMHANGEKLHDSNVTSFHNHKSDK